MGRLRVLFAFPVSWAGATDGVLAVRVWKAKLASFDYRTLGGMKGPPVVGDAERHCPADKIDDFASMRQTSTSEWGDFEQEWTMFFRWPCPHTDYGRSAFSYRWFRNDTERCSFTESPDQQAA
jgi:hypothetical protein